MKVVRQGWDNRFKLNGHSAGPGILSLLRVSSTWLVLRKVGPSNPPPRKNKAHCGETTSDLVTLVINKEETKTHWATEAICHFSATMISWVTNEYPSSDSRVSAGWALVIHWLILQTLTGWCYMPDTGYSEQNIVTTSKLRKEDLHALGFNCFFSGGGGGFQNMCFGRPSL